jgi:NAD(P)-dependent dehydrogenase (short-subunit alcohol dehydrogenase family)
MEASRSALVTGAARGIGRVIAERLVADGLGVSVADLPASKDRSTGRGWGRVVPCIARRWVYHWTIDRRRWRDVVFMINKQSIGDRGGSQ